MLKGSQSSKQIIPFKHQPAKLNQKQRYQSGAPALKTSTTDLQLLSTCDMFKAPSAGSASGKVPHKTLDQLLIHNSDTWVRPIIGNPDIEKEVPLPPLLVNNLDFEPWPVHKIAELIDTPEIDSHMTEIYKSLAGPVTINQKQNALIYFESIIVNSNVSNRLINSMFVSMLVRMLQTVKAPGVRQRLCSVIGLLVRHSTVIDVELAESEVCSVLV